MLLVVGFGSIERARRAYGIAVTGEMLVTTILLVRRHAPALEVAAGCRRSR